MDKNLLKERNTLQKYDPWALIFLKIFGNIERKLVHKY